MNYRIMCGNWSIFLWFFTLNFCGNVISVSVEFDSSERTFYMRKPSNKTPPTATPEPKISWSKHDFDDRTFYRRTTKGPQLTSTTVSSTTRKPKTKVSCEKKPKVPTSADVDGFLKLNPPTAKEVYESNGIFEGDMTGMKITVDVGEKKIITPKEIDQETLRWPNKIIPYAFYEKIQRKVMMTVLDAMADMERKTCIRFIPWTFEETYLKISPGRACASDVGYTKGEHILSVNTGCLDDLGAIQHEIMHALGIIHEQSRPDRDQHVYINFENIQPDRASQAQFYTFQSPLILDLGIPYDYLSVMHYPMNAFAIDKNTPSIMPYKKDAVIGNRVELSSLDIKRISRLYRCSDNPLDDQRDPIPKSISQGYLKNFKEWSKLCDGNRDTPEGWDEDPDVCLRMCRRLDSSELGPDGSNLFNKGFSKQCLHKKQLCDGQAMSSSDVLQQPNTCRRYCRMGGYVSMPASSQCIHFLALCDGQNDTVTGEDEDESVCQRACQSKSTGFEGQLFNSEEAGMRCLKKDWLCDGKSKNGPLAEPDYCAKYCKGNGYLPVGDEMQCIHWRKLCDGRIDTVSRLDEDTTTCQLLCDRANEETGGELFNLPGTMQCVSKRWLCDGTQRDRHGVLEQSEFCQEKCTGGGFLPTQNTGQCLHVTNLCDGKFDVRNGWDENKANCVRFCKATADYPPVGFRLQLNNVTKQCMVTEGQNEAMENISEKSGLDWNELPSNNLKAAIARASRDPVCSANEQGNSACSCPSGWQKAGLPPRCIDIDECSMSNPCKTGKCINIKGGYTCKCPKGYQLSKGRCIDKNECAGPKPPCTPGVCMNREGGYECFCPAGYQAKLGACVATGGGSSASTSVKPDPIKVPKSLSDTLTKMGISINNQGSVAQSSVSRSGKALDVSGSASSSSSTTAQQQNDTSANTMTEFGYILGKAEAHPVAGAANTFEMRFPDRTHLLLYCKEDKVIITLSADYVGGSAGCMTYSEKSAVARKCDELPICGFIARDPSRVPGCSQRELVVRYSCAALSSPFDVDLKTENMCNSNSTSDDVKETVQCNMSAISLIP